MVFTLNKDCIGLAYCWIAGLLILYFICEPLFNCAESFHVFPLCSLNTIPSTNNEILLQY